MELFRGIDCITGEIIEAFTKENLIDNLNIRFEAYKEAFTYQNKTPFVICIKGIYYLGIK